ncbi:MAG: Clp protease N-terminal domain-containing protein [Actinomycetota bacterium]
MEGNRDQRYPVQTVVTQAREEARAAGLPTIEAEHLLLAIARHSGSPAARILTEAGLDHDAIAAALAVEVALSLEAAGIPATAFPHVQPGTGARRSRHQPRLAESTRLAFHRSMQATTGPRTLTELHLLAGVLRAEVGTVPRALAFAGIDRAALLAHTQEAIAAGD